MSRSGALYALTNVANTFTQPQTINSPAAGVIPLTLNMASGQTAHALDVVSFASVVEGWLDAVGNFRSTGIIQADGALVGNQDIFKGDLPTIASANTIAPLSAACYVSGTTTIKTITPTTTMTAQGSGVIILNPTGLWITDTTGNIALATVAIINRPLTLLYSAAAAKWYPSY